MSAVGGLGPSCGLLPGKPSSPSPGRGSGAHSGVVSSVPGGSRASGGPSGRSSGPLVGRGSNPADGRTSALQPGRSAGRPPESAPGPLNGRGPAPMGDRSPGPGGRGPGSAGGRRTGRDGRGGRVAVPDEGVEALKEIFDYIKEKKRIAELLSPLPTSENIGNIRKMGITIRRMMKLLKENGPGGKNDRLAQEMEALSVSRASNQASAEQRQIEANFKQNMAKLQDTVNMYEKALDCANKNQPDQFREIMGPIVESEKSHQ